MLTGLAHKLEGAAAVVCELAAPDAGLWLSTRAYLPSGGVGCRLRLLSSVARTPGLPGQDRALRWGVGSGGGATEPSRSTDRACRTESGRNQCLRGG